MRPASRRPACRPEDSARESGGAPAELPSALPPVLPGETRELRGGPAGAVIVQEPLRITPSSTISRGVVMLPSIRPVERMITFSVENTSPRTTPPMTTVPACSVHSALPFWPTRTLPLVRIVPGEIPVDAQQAVQVELALEPRALPDDRVDEGIVGDVRIAHSPFLPFTFTAVRSGLIERKFWGST